MTIRAWTWTNPPHTPPSVSTVHARAWALCVVVERASVDPRCPRRPRCEGCAGLKPRRQSSRNRRPQNPKIRFLRIAEYTHSLDVVFASDPSPTGQLRETVPHWRTAIHAESTRKRPSWPAFHIVPARRPSFRRRQQSSPPSLADEASSDMGLAQTPGLVPRDRRVPAIGPYAYESARGRGQGVRSAKTRPTSTSCAQWTVRPDTYLSISAVHGG